MNQGQVLICYNEPHSLYENYIGKEVKKNEDNIDLSETEFLQSIDRIHNSLNKNFPVLLI